MKIVGMRAALGYVTLKRKIDDAVQRVYEVVGEGGLYPAGSFVMIDETYPPKRVFTLNGEELMVYASGLIYCTVELGEDQPPVPVEPVEPIEE